MQPLTFGGDYPRAFAYRVDDPKADIHLLVGHDYDRPLASRAAGTLHLLDGDGALTFEATITPEMLGVGYVSDLLAMFAAGLIGGISPGFRIPPERTVPNAEQVSEEDPREGTALIRTVFAALLYEMSLVTVPAYKETEVEARDWSVPREPEWVVAGNAYRSVNRWR